jgi:hypothetical protein
MLKSPVFWQFITMHYLAHNLIGDARRDYITKLIKKSLNTLH